MNIKKNCLIIAILGITYSAISQDLNKQVKTVEKQTEAYYNELQTKIKNLQLDFSSLELEMKNTKSVIKDKTDIDLTNRNEKIAEQEHFLIQTSEFVKSASKSFRAIDASIAQSSYLQDVITLNNPTNDDLGFSLKTVIDELIEQHILSKDKKLGKAGKVNEFVTSLIEHPIADIAKSAVPAINTVVSFISNLSFGSKKISEEDFKKFTEGLKKYVEHYEGLAKATNEYESNLQQIQIRTAALEVYLETFSIDRMVTLHPDVDIFEKNTVLTFNELLRKYYSDEVIKAQLNKVEGDVLKDTRYSYPITALNQARYIQDELESLSNQYIRVNYSYYESISKTLEKSKELDEKYVPKIDKKLTELKKSLETWLVKYQALVDVDDVKKEFNELIK